MNGICSGVFMSDITNSLRFCSNPAACVLEIDHILTLLPLCPPPRELTAALAALLVAGGQGCVYPLSVCWAGVPLALHLHHVRASNSGQAGDGSLSEGTLATPT